MSALISGELAYGACGGNPASLGPVIAGVASRPRPGSAESFGDELSAPAEATRKTEMLVVGGDLLDLD